MLAQGLLPEWAKRKGSLRSGAEGRGSLQSARFEVFEM